MKDEYEQAMNQAMYYLGVRARTVKQMEDYLIKKQHDEHTIARVMDRFLSANCGFAFALPKGSNTENSRISPASA